MDMKNNQLIFLSREWVSRAVAEIEWAKKHDKDVGKRASEFTLRIAYVVKGISKELREIYGSDSLVIYIGLDKGKLTEFDVVGLEDDVDHGDFDFIISSSYDVMKKIFRGDITVVEAYMGRRVKIEPFHKLYVNPRFTARSLTMVSILLRILRKRLNTIYL